MNLGVKSLYARQRPDRAGAGVPDQRQVPMPSSSSFPSGHSAAGFAFASAVGRELPWLGSGLRFAAAAVAYSRVHTGVHYPGDTVVGSLIGAGTGQAVAGVMDRRRRKPAPNHRPGPGRAPHRERPGQGEQARARRAVTSAGITWFRSPITA